MATQLSSSASMGASKAHPLDPLTPAEIKQVSSLLKAYSPDKSLHFKYINILEPPKKQLRPFLRAERNAFTKHPSPSRLASVLYYHRGTADLFQATVNLDTSKVESAELLDSRYHAQADRDEIIELRDVCMQDVEVLAAIKALKLPESFKIVCDTWPYGRDNDDATTPRMVQVSTVIWSQSASLTTAVLLVCRGSGSPWSKPL